MVQDPSGHQGPVAWFSRLHLIGAVRHLFPHVLKKAHCGAGRNVERLDRAQVRYRERCRGQRHQIFRHTAPLVTEQPVNFTV